jgi:hypothetical protein
MLYSEYYKAQPQGDDYSHLGIGPWSSPPGNNWITGEQGCHLQLCFSPLCPPLKIPPFSTLGLDYFCFIGRKRMMYSPLAPEELLSVSD